MLLQVLFANTNGKDIKIQIDSDDVMKIVEGIMKSRTFRDVAAEMVERSNLKRGIYNNPYHPEDDKSDSVEIGIKRKQVKNSEENGAKVKLNKLKQSDDKIEKDNENYILDGVHISEDELETIDIDTEKITLSTTSTTPISTNNKNSKINDLQNFKNMQKRFVLKHS